MDDDPIARLHAVERHERLLSVPALQPDLIDLQRHAFCQIVHGLLVRPLVQRLADAEQEAHGARRGKVPGQQRHADGDAVQNIHGESAAAQHPERAPDARRSQTGIDRSAEDQRQEELFQITAHDLHDKLLLVFPVDRAAVAAQNACLLRRFLVREGSQRVIQRFTRSAVDDDHAADALVHRRLIHAPKRQQPGLQQVGLLHAHRRLHRSQADAPAALMQNLKSHLTPWPRPR